MARWSIAENSFLKRTALPIVDASDDPQGAAMAAGAVQNITLPTRNVSPVYIEARERFDRTLVEIGLPER
jgi:hypothetical protein